MTTPLTFTDEAVQLCPFPAYAKLRAEQPIYKDPVTGHFILTRYDDVRKVLLNPETFSSRTPYLGNRWRTEANRLFEQRGWLPMNTLVSNDPPEHRRFRKLVDRVFTTNRVALLEPRIDDIINSLIDGFSGNSEIDFLATFSTPLPMLVISEQLGVDHNDRDRFKLWSNTMVETMEPNLTPEREMELAHIVLDMQLYMAKQIERVRRKPDGMLLSQLANLESEGRRLELGELQSLLMQILVAGNDTTTTTLGSCMKLLIEQPKLAQNLHDDPDVAQRMVEETLRVAAPLQTLFRRVKLDSSISGVDIPEGAIVEVRFGAANLDPAQFTGPADVDLTRSNAASHLTFGTGIHMCVGNQLARSELKLALQALTRRLKNFRYSRGDQSTSPLRGYASHGLRTLWMTFEFRNATG